MQTEKSDFYKLWQQHKLLKTMEMGEVWSDTYDEGYLHQFYCHKIYKKQLKQWVKKYTPMEHLSGDHEDHSISPRIVQGYAMKRGGLFFWVYRRVNGTWDNNLIRISQWRKSHCRTNASIRRKKEIQKRVRPWELSLLGTRVRNLTIWVRLFEKEKLQQSSPGLSVPSE